MVIGTAGFYCDPAYFAELRANPPGDVVVLESADHSMEIESDPEQSILVLRDLMWALQGFVSSSRAE